MIKMKKKLPIGIEDFEEILQKDFYYIDKTGLTERYMKIKFVHGLRIR